MLIFNLDFRLSLIELFLVTNLVLILVIPVFVQRLNLISDRIPVLKSGVFIYITQIWLCMLIYLTQQPIFNLFKFDFYLVRNEYTLNIQFLLTILILILLVSLFSYENKETINYEEYFFLAIILSSSFIMVAINDLLVFYLILEMQTFCFFLLTATKKHSQIAAEASIKYFILSSLGSAFLLLGISLIYKLTGTCNITDLTLIFSNFQDVKNITTSTNKISELNLGWLLILISFIFKFGLAPFHSWLPIIYKSMPKEFLMFLAFIPKFAMLAFLAKLIFINIAVLNIILIKIAPFIMFTSLIIGILGALNTTNFTQFLAYTSIVNMGFVFSAFLIENFHQSNWLFFIVFIQYAISGIGLYLLLIILPNDQPISNTFNIKDLYNYNNKNLNLLVISSIIILFSNIGIPPLAGFFGKFYILLLLFEQNSYFLGTTIFLLSMISAFYYLRIIKLQTFEKKLDIKYISSFSNSVNIILISFVVTNIIFLGIKNDITNTIIQIIKYES